ncbi:MAG: T9SS type A sorting domain-containing protein [Bacteroidetes bacterium]|nr:T9SS type A sorting domain-containing protein [Bacteroidota bacterium]
MRSGVKIFSVLFSSSSLFSFSQTWSDVGGGVTFTSMPSLSSIYAMATDTINNVLYVSGTFDSAGSVSGCGSIAKWNGVSWDTLLDNSNSPGAASLEIFNSELYAGRAHVEKWNGMNWTPIGTGVSWNGVQYDLCVYNGEMYTAGDFTIADGNPAKHIAKWNGTSWVAVGSGVNNWIWSLCVYNGELYAGGVFDSAGTVPINYIAKWNGTNWSSVGGGINSAVNTLCVYNGELYAGGGFPYLSKWNGTTWTVITGINSTVDYLQVFNNKLVFIGEFSTPGQSIAQCNASNASPLTNGAITVGNSLTPASDMAVFNGSLYVGGFNLMSAGIFPNAISCNNIASYSLPNSINENINSSTEINIHPNPFSTTTTIEIENANEKIKNAQFILHDILGRVAMKSEITNSKIEIKRDNLPNGIYFLRVKINDATYSEKIIITN